MIVTFNSEEEWKSYRKGKITGTIASAIMGLNPYMSNVEAWEIICGITEPQDISEKECVKKGKEAENHIRKLFALDHQEYIVEDNSINNVYKVCCDDDYPFLMATTDGFLTHVETQKQGVLEIKTSDLLNRSMSEQWKDGHIPNNYYIQLLMEMRCSNAKFAILVAELKYNEETTTRRTYLLERENYEEDIKYMVDKLISFWNEYVIPRKKPSLKLVF